MSLPSLVIFDMDGLIFDTERLFMTFLQQVAREHGYEVTESHFVQTLGIAKTDCIAIMKGLMGQSYPSLEISNETRVRMNAYAANHPLPVKSGIRQLLGFLREKALPCCIASSSPKATVELYLKQTGLEECFSFVMSGDNLTHSKPNPEIFLTCLQHYGIPPEQAVVLEDAESGIRAAVSATIPVICIPDMKEPSDELRQQCLLVAKDALEVLDFLDQGSA